MESLGILKIGDRVGTLPAYGYCGTCDTCKVAPQICDHLEAIRGVTADGAFAEYMIADSRSVSILPPNISFPEAAPLFCAGATIYGAIQSVNPLSGQWIAVIGVGGLGHLGVQYAKALGLKVVAIDNRQEGIDLAVNNLPEHLRPDRTYLVDTEEAKANAVKELKGSFYDSNPGVDRVVIATPDPKAISFAQEFTRKGGIICDVGLPTNAPFEVDAFTLNFKQQSIKGSLLCTPADGQQMVNLHAASGCRTHIGKAFKLDEINEMVSAYESGKVKGRLCVSFE